MKTALLVFSLFLIANCAMKKDSEPDPNPHPEETQQTSKDYKNLLSWEKKTKNGSRNEFVQVSWPELEEPNWYFSKCSFYFKPTSDYWKIRFYRVFQKGEYTFSLGNTDGNTFSEVDHLHLFYRNRVRVKH